MAAGESAGARAAALESAAARHLRKAEQAGSAAEKWRKGQEGEERVSAVLAPLVALDFFHLHDRRLPGSRANIDHVVVGPPGVLVIDTKNWSGSLRTDGGALRQNGQRRDLGSVQRQADAITGILERELRGQPIAVRAVVCFAGSASLGAPVSLGEVHLVDGDALVELIRSMPRSLTGPQIDAAQALLLRCLPRRTDPVEPDDVLPALSTPTEELLLLEPWRKSGRSRLYVKVHDGTQVGYLDVLGGTACADAGDWSPLLDRLVPHYAAPGAPDEGTAAQTTAPDGMMRRFLRSMTGKPVSQPAEQSPLLVVARLKVGGDRLDVHRIDERGGRVKLGTYDLADGDSRAPDPSNVATVRYCGRAFGAAAARGRSL